MTILVVALVLMLVLIVIGSPVHVAIGMSAMLVFIADGLPFAAAAHVVVGGVNSFTLIAIPFFILAGQLMNVTGITDRIFNLARVLLGWAPGGLGYVNIGSSVVFAGMSGAAVADAGGLGAIEIKAMREAGYERGFAVGVTAASSVIGPIIPPSLPLIIYGVMAEVSIKELFLAGLIPGLLMALSLMLMVAWQAKRKGFPVDDPFSKSLFVQALREAWLSLLCPFIIVGGIVSGVFTPTEAAVAAVAYVLFLGFVVYRTLTVGQLLNVMLDTGKTTASVLLIVAAAALFSWVLTANQAAELLSSELLSLSDHPLMILGLIMLLTFVLGLIMETIAAITIMVPLVLPLALHVGIDPVLLGILMVLNLMLGLITPPVGMVIYVLAKVSNIPFEECVMGSLPFLVPLLIVLIALMLFPGIALWLPGLI